MPATSYAFVKVDVFTTVAFEGNPLADPQNAARVRIFTPRSEMAFAGHPTLGTAFVVRGDSATDRLVLEEGVGPVPVRIARTREGAVQFWLTTPPIAFGERIDPAPVAANPATPTRSIRGCLPRRTASPKIPPRAARPDRWRRT